MRHLIPRMINLHWLPSLVACPSLLSSVYSFLSQISNHSYYWAQGHLDHRELDLCFSLKGISWHFFLFILFFHFFIHFWDRISLHSPLASVHYSVTHVGPKLSPLALWSARMRACSIIPRFASFKSIFRFIACKISVLNLTYKEGKLTVVFHVKSSTEELKQMYALTWLS